LDLGVLVDIVPNHMGIATPHQNEWWWDVLTNGRHSPHAPAFDIDWQFGSGQVRVPVLGDEAAPDVRLDDGELHYHAHRFPLAPGSADDAVDVATVLGRQHYQLMNWRRADFDLNYRRFFAVSTLAGIRTELPNVFDASHVEIVRWVADGLVDGLRVDHPDGLADPAGYLDALAAATDGVYVVVEKILAVDENLPMGWAASGTTGYEAMADIDRVLIDPAGEPVLTDLDRTERHDPADAVTAWCILIHGTKRAVADGILRAEVLRLERDVGMPSTADAIAELLACFPVYRSYLPHGIEHLHAAALAAKMHRPELTATIDVLVPLLADPTNAGAIRFQQTSGMVMAKGVEDCAFYRSNRLGSLTEVGGDPSQFAIDVDRFHDRQRRRQVDRPHSLTSLTTHDTKRSEDVRARLDVLAEVPDEWSATLTQLRAAAPLGDASLENLLWQAVVGSWPATRRRLHAYAEKAAREAGLSTSWADPSKDFEQLMHAMIDATFDDPRIACVVEHFVGRIRSAGYSNSLSAKLLQLTMPGVPDVYQGTELWDLSLVDPDNRRPVDFELRRQMLADLEAGALPDIDESGAAKLLVTSRALRLRRDRPDLFTSYRPVTAQGSVARHLVAFDRGGAVAVATRLPIGLQRAGGWGETSIELSQRCYVDALTGASCSGARIRMETLLAHYPVALLVPARSDG
jgi:(1->4)-alpha-D-glucan 1-alpha-D-glucosylmutase